MDHCATWRGVLYLGDLVTLIHPERLLVSHFMLEDIKMSYLSTQSLYVLLYKILQEHELAVNNGGQL